MKVLILSPHCDDVPLSLGGALLNHYFGNDVSVTVVFSVSKYTKNQKGNAECKLTTKIRKTEEKKAAKIAGYHVSFMDFEEPFVRPGFNKLEDICDRNRIPQMDLVWSKVKSSLLSIIENQIGIILAPLGFGDHIDHKIVSMIFRENYISLSRCIPMFYEDLPYASNCKKEFLDEILPQESRHNNFKRVLTQCVPLNEKLNLIKNYKSQITDEYVIAIKDHWNENKGEFIWTTNEGELALNEI